jgi:hypothetical protein
MISPTPNPKAGGPPLVGCPRLLIQYIRSYLSYLEAFSSILTLGTRHAVVTKDAPRRGWEYSMKMDLREIGIYGVNCIRLAQDRVQWRAFVNMVMYNLRVS